MRNVCRTLLLIALAGLAGPTAASDDPPGKATDEVLAAMDRTSTWGHPDLANEFSGMHYYEAGHYKEALASFRTAARYADKLSQLSIGLMYLDGQGVEKDPVAAFAWVAIAAERKYPQFIATRDAIWAMLDAEQRERAKALVGRLYPEYGDATAKPRMAKVLRRNRMVTGSLLGFGGSSVASLTPAQYMTTLPPSRQESSGGPMPPCGAHTIEGGPMTGCGNLYVEWRWNPDVYFKTRDAAWIGTVTVGPLQQVGNVRRKAEGGKAGDPL